jgi:syndetin
VQDVLPILAELRLALDMQMELETFVEKENYFQVIFSYLTSQ